MKDNAESRGTGNQLDTQSDTTTQHRGSQFSNQSSNLPGSNPGRPDQEIKQPRNQSGKTGRTGGTQQSASQGSRAGTAQTSPQTHDTSNAAPSGQGSSGR